MLIDWFQQRGRDADAARMFKRYKNDGGTEWLWPAALAAYRKSGDCPASRAALERALNANAHVRDYLLGGARLPRTLPEYVMVGGVDEAAAYITQAPPTWDGTPGALMWLLQQTVSVPDHEPHPGARGQAKASHG